GKALQIIVRYEHMDNAYYDGEKMVLGGGDPNGLFKDLSAAPDVTYHEVGHAMTERVLTAGNEVVKASVDFRVQQGMISPQQGADMYKQAVAERAAREVRASAGVGARLGA